MTIFYLKREEDESGISGTGRVAQGFVFDNGKVAVTWLSEHPSVTIYDNIGEVHAIHGHGGKTMVEFEPDYKRACNEMKSFIENFRDKGINETWLLKTKSKIGLKINKLGILKIKKDNYNYDSKK